jgi:hypothetical protein
MNFLASVCVYCFFRQLNIFNWNVRKRLSFPMPAAAENLVPVSDEDGSQDDDELERYDNEGKETNAAFTYRSPGSSRTLRVPVHAQLEQFQREVNQRGRVRRSPRRTRRRLV